MRRSHPAGFTLIEILVVLVICGLLMVALWGGMRVGVSGWHRVARTSETQSAQSHTERLLRMNLEALDPDDNACQGDAQRLVCAATASLQAGAQPQAIRLALGVRPGVGVVMRRVARNGSGHVVQDVVAPGVEALGLRYFMPGTGWSDHWPSGRGAPDLIEVTLKEVGRPQWPAIIVHPNSVFPGAAE